MALEDVVQEWLCRPLLAGPALLTFIVFHDLTCSLVTKGKGVTSNGVLGEGLAMGKRGRGRGRGGGGGAVWRGSSGD